MYFYEGGGILMQYSNDYLCHYGVLGMKWGQHIAAKQYGNSVKSTRKQNRAKGKAATSVAGRIGVGLARSTASDAGFVGGAVAAASAYKTYANPLKEAVAKVAAKSAYKSSTSLSDLVKNSSKAVDVTVKAAKLIDQSQDAVILGGAAIGALAAYAGAKAIANKYYEKKGSK